MSTRSSLDNAFKSLYRGHVTTTDVLIEHLERVLVDGWEGKALCGVSADFSRGHIDDWVVTVPKCSTCYLLRMANPDEIVHKVLLWTEKTEADY